MKIKWELKAFNDWYLAIAGENGQRLALKLAQDKSFWRSKWFRYGWRRDSTPYEKAMKDIHSLSEQDFDFMQWFYEKSGIFELENFRASKVGSWCYWVSVKFLKEYLILSNSSYSSVSN